MIGSSAPTFEAAGGHRSLPRSTRSPTAAVSYAYVAFGAALAVAYFLLDGQAAEIAYEAISASCVVAIVVGIRRYRPTPTLPWWLLAGGITLWLIGDVTWSWYPYLTNQELPFPSPADLAYLAGYPLVTAAVALIVHTRREVLRTEGWLDAAIITVSAAALIWEIDLEGHVVDGITLGEATNMAYTILDVALIGIVARLLFAPSRWSTSLTVLVVSFWILFLTDATYAREVVSDWWTFDQPLNAGWMVSYILIGAAALHPSMRSVTYLPDVPERTISRARTAALGLAAAAPLIELTVGSLLGNQDGSYADTGVLMLVLVAMVAVRITWVIAMIEDQAVEVADLHRERGYVLDEITRAIEDERTRLAAELHDGPIQRLTGYGMRAYVGVRKLRGGDQAAAVGTLEGIGDGLNAEVRGLRALMSQLRPPVLSERGLVDALRDHADAIASERGIVTSVEGPPDLRLGPDLETGLYRIAQEALMNATRHSGAGRVDVGVEMNDGRVRLTVRDDGSGFDAAEKLGHREGHHFGLLAMRERASMLHGDLKIVSVPGEGTTVTVDAPLGEEP